MKIYLNDELLTCERNDVMSIFTIFHYNYNYFLFFRKTILYVCPINLIFELGKLLEKHKFNLDSAEYLIGESQYAPSVHCSYYSCFQLMKHKVRAIKGCTYDELEKHMKGESSHTYLINEAKYYLNPKNNAKIKNPVIAANFKDSIKDLKTFRMTSDYENVEISSENAGKSYNLAREICTILKKI